MKQSHRLTASRSIIANLPSPDPRAVQLYTSHQSYNLLSRILHHAAIPLDRRLNIRTPTHQRRCHPTPTAPKSRPILPQRAKQVFSVKSHGQNRSVRCFFPERGHPTVRPTIGNRISDSCGAQSVQGTRSVHGLSSLSVKCKQTFS